MQSAELAQKLVDTLVPHLLRRTKDDVNLGIMPMEETLISVEITNFQKQTYRALLEQVATSEYDSTVEGPCQSSRSG